MNVSPSSLVTFGESMGRIAPDQIGLLDFGRSSTISIGGAESNVAIGAARLGADVTWAGRLGRDAVGDLIARRLRSEGVRTRITRDPGFTGLMVCSRRTSTGVRVDYHRAGSAGSQLTPDDIGDHVLRSAGILHVTGITPALSETARETVFWAVRRAHTFGVVVSFDVNYRSKLWDQDEAGRTLGELAAEADILFASPDEAALLMAGTGRSPEMLEDPLALAHALACLGPREVIIKDGPRGCAAVIDGHEYVQPAFAVEAIDPVGAGDAFVAGYLAERLAGVEAPGRLDMAVRTGAYAVSVPGDCEGMPFREELTSLISVNDVIR